ncbi:hypothetical protein DXX93_11070 [Thalassotalea euphylliae]|uniref:Uncharacterized protein n=1 Tax=Thalassotalea euphylliae TaxID=1655234 RepID=A0A3E0TQ82_9GAMM|nr:hypothetical protein [Thalassotalea euphylliae]REL26689.1 hypothetical protein DXX93_08945 [Thalassotalea euphylliae]REL27043.1 hypothetical protein DXX93_11040 [Thalassotalea euphylliae]REL27049.1 hypothetical protein DXX93_11070 [Thalassotalea euphylliae]
MNNIHLFAAFFIIYFLSGCAVGYEPWAEFQDKLIGKKAWRMEPHRFENAGELIRADYLVAGEGFTHTSVNENGDIIQHWFDAEVLPNFYNKNEMRGHKEWIGKCKFYLVVDPETYVIKSWGHDEGGNPQSCRHWP